MKTDIVYGRHTKTNEIKYISDVESGENCNCICIECGNILVAVNKEGNKQKPHFRHKSKLNCSGGVETAIHLLAKEIVVKNNKIALPRNRYFIYDKSESEVALSDYTPDVIIENSKNGEKWLIEIAVTHPVDETKKNKIIRDKNNCLEINLKDIDRDISREKLEEIVLNDFKNRKTIFDNKKAESNLFEYALYLMIGFIMIRVLKRIFK
jgi:hypothetical protein